MGDINLDWQKWSAPDYDLVRLVEQVKEMQADCAMQQTVVEPTRLAKMGDTVIWSTIDHCYVSSTHNFTQPIVLEVGDSDHLGVEVEKIYTFFSKGHSEDIVQTFLA